MQDRLKAIVIVFAAALTFFSLVQVLHAGEVSLQIQKYEDYYLPGQHLLGRVTITYDGYVPRDSVIAAYIDRSPASSLGLSSYLYDISYYDFIPHSFSYEIRANGKSEWTNYPDQNFSFRISAYGTCGQEDCAKVGACNCAGLCTPPTTLPYYCYWEVVPSQDMGSDSVNPTEGLKFIYEGSYSISPPVDNNGDTEWKEIGSANPYVETTMREACSNQDYMGYTVSPDGWVRRRLQESELEVIGGTNHREAYIEPFDHLSLGKDRIKYLTSDCIGQICGGIYKDGVYQTSPVEVEWNGSAGHIIIYNYNYLSDYDITYLPPNGPNLCAFTNYTESGSTTWSRGVTRSGTTKYSQPYERTYTEDELPTVYNETNIFTAIIQPPACPDTKCDYSVTKFTVTETSDPGGTVSIDFDEYEKKVTATTSSTDFTHSYSANIMFENFPDLEAMGTPGPHELLFEVKYKGDVIVSDSVQFDICLDIDNDGYCRETTDCNDSNPDINPGQKEKCNGIDDDCDLDVDEDFWEAGSKLGDSCGVGICTGYYVCTGDGKDVKCNSEYQPGEKPEVCDNELDDDCDGETDELMEIVNGTAKKACICAHGDTRPCGSNIGACEQGIRRCVHGVWTECEGKKGPYKEVCNTIDDDCDEVVDNLYGGKSIEETGCGCYNDKPPVAEKCNDIDDDCDGETDEGIICCDDGDQKTCGINVGICTEGTKTCRNGVWSECEGSTNPNPGGEICFNRLDDDCDGETDEGCNYIEFICNNEEWDEEEGEEGIDCGGPCPDPCPEEPKGLPLPMIFFAVAGILLLLAFTLSILMKKPPSPA